VRGVGKLILIHGTGIHSNITGTIFFKLATKVSMIKKIKFSTVGVEFYQRRLSLWLNISLKWTQEKPEPG
jgi:hypothetical protein